MKFSWFSKLVSISMKNTFITWIVENFDITCIPDKWYTFISCVFYKFTNRQIYSNNHNFEYNLILFSDEF